MKKTPSHAFTKWLADEIERRETLDPDFFIDLKQLSIDKTLKAGVSPEVIKGLFGNE